jgi:hypothetical protein
VGSVGWLVGGFRFLYWFLILYYFGFVGLGFGFEEGRVGGWFRFFCIGFGFL